MSVEERLAKVEAQLPWIADAVNENRKAVTTLAEKFDSYVKMTLGGLGAIILLVIAQWITR